MYEKYEEKNPLLCQSTTIKAWLIFNDLLPHYKGLFGIEGHAILYSQ